MQAKRNVYKTIDGTKYLQMTQQERDKKHKDYKSTLENGDKATLILEWNKTILTPVMIVKEIQHERYSENLRSDDLVTEDFYTQQMEVLPPAYMNQWVFCVWEAHDTNSRGERVYSTFQKKQNKHYWKWYNTKKEAERLTK